MLRVGYQQFIVLDWGYFEIMQKKRYIDVFFSIAVLFLIIWITVDSGAVLIIVPIVLLLVSVAFFICAKFKDNSIVSRLFFFISYNIIVPRNEKNHLIWGAAFFVLGGSSLFYFLNRKDMGLNNTIVREPSIQDYQSWWYKDPIFWIIIALLLIIGLYRAKCKKK